jgi:hypothetical protein
MVKGIEFTLQLIGISLCQMAQEADYQHCKKPFNIALINITHTFFIVATEAIISSWLMGCV